MLPRNWVTVTELYGKMNKSSWRYLEVLALLEASSSVCGCSFGFGFLGLLSAGSLKNKPQRENPSAGTHTATIPQILTVAEHDINCLKLKTRLRLSNLKA